MTRRIQQTHQQKEQNQMIDIDTDTYEITIDYLDGTHETITATNHQRDGLAVRIMTDADEEVLLSLTAVKKFTVA